MGKKSTKRATRLPKEFLAQLKQVKAKRPKVVIDHILKFGHVTTEELKEKYGYDHPPRAARDVRERGIPLETFWIKDSHGRKIAAYRFGDPSEIKKGKLGGRKAWPKGLKKTLEQLKGTRCSVCYTEYELRYLQIDHRIPFEICGEPTGAPDPNQFMLLCGSCNRAKSWSCEHCANWQADHTEEVCQSCYWVDPENYAHIALRLIRRLELTWTEQEVPHFDRLVELSKQAKQELPDFVKDVLHKALGDEPE